MLSESRELDNTWIILDVALNLDDFELSETDPSDHDIREIGSTNERGPETSLGLVTTYTSQSDPPSRTLSNALDQ